MGEVQDAVGTWTQTGANVRLLQKGHVDRQSVLVLDLSGRRMTLTLGRSKAQIVFTRA